MIIAASIAIILKTSDFNDSSMIHIKFLKTFSENFDGSFVLEETDCPERSSSNFWWLNSGAQFFFQNGIGSTLRGDLPADSKWRIAFLNYNAESSDDGFHPQNIFRLVTKSKWQNFQQELYFRITDYHLSPSEHRSESNGVLLFNRYYDGDNLYYAGIRVDGAAVIKKKEGGEYYTMAYNKIFEGGDYDKNSNPNLLPINQWMGIRSEVHNSGKDVIIKLYIDEKNSGNWKLVLDAVDDGKKYGGNSLVDKSFAGIRTDFMDIEFDSYSISEY